jgi:tRNA dimethylallyltransferase
MRAVEIATLTGQRLSRLHMDNARRPEFTPRYLVLDPGERLRGMIEERTRGMLDGGWLEEVARLEKCVPDGVAAWKATGYVAVRKLLAGVIQREEAERMVNISTRQYAKRQRTWFGNQLPKSNVTKLKGNEADCERVIERWWNERGSEVHA